MTGSLKISSRCNTIITAIRRELPPKRATNIAEVVIHTRFTAIEETADFPRRRVSGDNGALFRVVSATQPLFGAGQARHLHPVFFTAPANTLTTVGRPVQGR